MFTGPMVIVPPGPEHCELWSRLKSSIGQHPWPQSMNLSSEIVEVLTDLWRCMHIQAIGDESDTEWSPLTVREDAEAWLATKSWSPIQEMLRRLAAMEPDLVVQADQH